MSTLPTTRNIPSLKAAGYDEASLNSVGHYEADAKHLESLLGYRTGAGGLVFVYQGINGEILTCADGKPFVRVKIDRSPAEVAEWEKRTGRKSGKYSCRKGSGCRFYFSQIQKDWQSVADRVSIPIFITEGEKKGDILCQAGYAAIALGGVSSWKSKAVYSEEKESIPIKDFDLIKWEGRTVFLTPDSDVTSPNKPQIRAAMKELADHLESLGAVVHLVVLPNNLEGEKLGADDFINHYGKDNFDSFVTTAPKALTNAGKSPKAGMILNIEPPKPYRQGEVVSILLSSDYAYREDIGWYRYTEGYWCTVGQTFMRKVFLKAYNNQHWDIDSAGSVSYIEKILPALSMVGEEKWNAPGFMLFNNGLYNPLLDKFLPSFDKSLYITHKPLNFPFVDKKETPVNFLRYIYEACAGDVKTVELIQAILKYVWLPKDKNRMFELEYAFDFYGGKGTGKSTLIEVIIAGLGQDNVADAAPSVFATPESVSQLIDKKAAISPDTLGYVANPDILNKVISNEQLTVRKLYQNPVFIRLGVTVVRAYNKIMSMSSGGEGQDRRLIVIEFNNKPKTVDTGLGRKLFAEMSQIMNWAFSLSTEEMTKRIRTRNGSKLADRASAERFAENNPVFQFLDDNFQEGHKGVKINELYAQYKVWGENQGIKQPLQQRSFKTAIATLGCTVVCDANGNPVKPQGYFKYAIPAMSDFNMCKHLGYLVEDSESYLEEAAIAPMDDPINNSSPVISEEIPGIAVYNPNSKFKGKPLEFKPFEYNIPDSLDLPVDDAEDEFKQFRYMDESD